LTAAVLDNDIVIKAAIYSMLDEVAATIAPSLSQCGVLGALRFVAVDTLHRRNLDALIPPTLALIDSAEELEPSQEEANAAAEIESLAQREGLQLDAGESLLFAIAETRGIRPLATGDKRAIAALELLLSKPTKEWWRESVVCLEQIALRLVQTLGAVDVRRRVCAAPDTDTALALCFSCKSQNAEPSEWIAGLTSYIEHLRTAAPTLLALS
jgi:hypothetical protein